MQGEDFHFQTGNQKAMSHLSHPSGNILSSNLVAPKKYFINLLPYTLTKSPLAAPFADKIPPSYLGASYSALRSLAFYRLCSQVKNQECFPIYTTMKVLCNYRIINNLTLSVFNFH